MRQIRKHPKQKSRSHKNYSSCNSKIVQRGGDDGRYVLPPAYFGKGMQGYYADGSSELNSCGKQNAVSHGVISADGKWAGPNLYPMMGGACGCSGRKSKSIKSKSQSASRRQFKPKTMKGGACPKKSLKTHQKGGMQPKKSKNRK
jgi:hypothetical protein